MLIDSVDGKTLRFQMFIDAIRSQVSAYAAANKWSLCQKPLKIQRNHRHSRVVIACARHFVNAWFPSMPWAARLPFATSIRQQGGDYLLAVMGIGPSCLRP